MHSVSKLPQDFVPSFFHGEGQVILWPPFIGHMGGNGTPLCDTTSLNEQVIITYNHHIEALLLISKVLKISKKKTLEAPLQRYGAFEYTQVQGKYFHLMFCH